MVGLVTTLSSVFRPSAHKLSYFILPVFFIYMADAAIAFVFPITIFQALKSNTMIGIIMAVSSVTGILFDSVVPIALNLTRWYTKLLLGIFIAGTVPVLTFLGFSYKSAVFFIFASAFWGIYYELISFSVHEFIISFSKKSTFTYFWGVVSSIFSMTNILGPVLGGYYFSLGIDYISYAILTAIGLSFVLTILVVNQDRSKIRKYKHIKYLDVFKNELKVWKILSSHAGTVFLAGILISLVDSMFWTIGGLYSIELFRGDERFNYVLILTATFAMVLGHYLVAKSRITSHKKKYANYAILSGSFLLIAMSFCSNVWQILLIIFMANMCFACARSFTDAVTSDLAVRLKGNYEFLIAFIRLQVSFAWIVGPMFVGILSDFYGYKLTFRIVSITVFLAGLVLLSLTPLKIKLPQNELKS